MRLLYQNKDKLIAGQWRRIINPLAQFISPFSLKVHFNIWFFFPFFFFIFNAANWLCFARGDTYYCNGSLRRCQLQERNRIRLWQKTQFWQPFPLLEAMTVWAALDRNKHLVLICTSSQGQLWALTVVPLQPVEALQQITEPQLGFIPRCRMAKLY